MAKVNAVQKIISDLNIMVSLSDKFVAQMHTNPTAAVKAEMKGSGIEDETIENAVQMAYHNQDAKLQATLK